jgi:hypothetical protein
MGKGALITAGALLPVALYFHLLSPWNWFDPKRDWMRMDNMDNSNLTKK